MSGIGSSIRDGGVTRRILEMRIQLGDLQQQLATGKKSTTYRDLGLNRSLSISGQSRLNAIAGYQQNIVSVDMRLNLIQTSLTRMDQIVGEQRADNLRTEFVPVDSTQTASQKSARQRLDDIFSLMNQDASGRRLFSGRANDRDATLSTDKVLNGDGSRVGLAGVIEERRRADQGSDFRGRLTLTQPTADTVRLSETNSGPFGLNITGVNSALSNATITETAESLPTTFHRFDLQFTAQPTAGQSITYSFSMPDGSSAAITLKATSGTPVDGEFAIGVDANATAANLQAALDTKLQNLVRTELKNTSALKASDDFFNINATRAPQRVDLRTVYGAVTQNSTLPAGETLGTFTSGTVVPGAYTGGTLSFDVLVSGVTTTVTTAAIPDNSSADDVRDAINAAISASGVSGRLTASNSGGAIRLDAADADVDFTINANTLSATLGLTTDAVTNRTGGALSSTNLMDLIISNGGATGNTLTLTANGGAAQMITFGYGSGQISTMSDLNTRLGALTGITASASGTSFASSVAAAYTPTSLAIAGSAAVQTTLGFTNNTATGVATTPTAENATALIDGTTTNTVRWYTGDDAVDDARSTSVAKVDNGIIVGYGLRANETGFRKAISNIAAFAAIGYSTSESTSAKSYQDMSLRIRNNLADQSGQTISSILGEIAVVHNSVQSINDRHNTSKSIFQNVIEDVEGVSKEEVATFILDLQTRLQASYQVTARLSELSLVNFI